MRRDQKTQWVIWSLIAVACIVVCALWLSFGFHAADSSKQVARDGDVRTQSTRPRSGVPGTTSRRSTVPAATRDDASDVPRADPDTGSPSRMPPALSGDRRGPLLKPSNPDDAERPSPPSTGPLRGPDEAANGASGAEIQAGRVPTTGQTASGPSREQKDGAATLYQHIDVQRSPKFAVHGMAMDQRIRYAILSRLEVQARIQDGTRKVVQHVEETRLEQADDLSRSTFQSSLDDLRRRQFTFILNRDNEVIDFRGFKKNVIPLPVNILDSKGFMLTSVIDEDGWKELAELSFFQPPQPTAAETPTSRSWVRQMTHDWSPLGNWYGTTTFTPRPTEGPLASYDFVHAMTYNPPLDGAAMPFRVSSAEFQPLQTSGTISYDPQIRRAVQAEETFHVRGNVAVELLGQSVPIQLEEKQLLTVRITSQDPRRPQ